MGGCGEKDTKKRRSIELPSDGFSRNLQKRRQHKQVFGRMVTLGKAYTIFAPVMFGVDFPSEKGQYLLLERLFKLVAYYTLSEEATQVIIVADEDKKEMFLMGLGSDARAKVRY